MPRRPTLLSPHSDSKRDAIGSGGVAVWGLGNWSTDKVWGVNDEARGQGTATGNPSKGQWGRGHWVTDNIRWG